MEQLKRKRRPLRSAGTKVVKDIDTELAKETPDLLELRVKLTALEVTEAGLLDIDDKVMNVLIASDCPDQELDDEVATVNDYRDKIVRARLKVNAKLDHRIRSPSPGPSVAESLSKRKTYKLPKIEIRKFGGNLTDWLGFWAQFEKIHEDEELHASDKFQYLVQSMVSGTRARELVDSYPQTAENYPKVISALQERFGKKKILMQVYVRELLKMVISNKGSREKITVCKMYDRLESHLRALESLGVTTEQMAVFLFPMVESSLPEDILVAWQRSPLNGCDGSKENPPLSELDYLIKFLRQEVENEDQRVFVQAGFDVTVKEKKQIAQVGQEKYKTSKSIPTASDLFSGGKSKCLFCDGLHESRECFKAQTMDLDDKRNMVKSKNCCFICLRPGHMSKVCKTLNKCLLCEKRHTTIMCPSLPVHKKRQSEKPASVPTNAAETSNSGLACSSKVILKTLMVTIAGKNRKRKVRALIDDGCQRSYILKSVVKDLGLNCCGSEDLIHALFSGVQTNVKHHLKYQLRLPNVVGRGFTKVTVLDQERICGEIPRLCQGSWMKSLREQNIWISDLGSSNEESPEVDMLLGADVIGKLLTGKVVQLKNGLTAVETKLGWTLMGKISGPDQECVAMTVTSMVVSQASLEELWNLETIGIKDPSEMKSKAQREIETRQHFMETVTIGSDGRYSVSLPWMDGVVNIPDNKNIAEKRLITVTRKLENEEKYSDYDMIFKSWESEGIIEVVGESDYERQLYYLPHRAVYKPESLTTPIRPVFDASCKTLRSPSLNECLEKGPNLLELIPSILLQFREKAIGVIADVRKAFQMIGVKEDDRNFLRFLWWEDQTLKKLKVYRHCRVVFGVNCSPFLLGAVIEFHLRVGKVGEEKDICEKLLKSLYVDNCVVSLDSVTECAVFKNTATRIMDDAKMDLRQWEFGSAEISGVGQLVNSWCGLDSGRIDSNLGLEKTARVLGLTWDKSADTLRCDFKLEDLPGKISKRSILSLTQKIFDPIGFTCPTTIVPKIILQGLWKEKIGWDDEVPEEVKRSFGRWHRDMGKICVIEVPRSVTSGVRIRKNWQLHMFCDASKSAYAAAVFLRTEDKTGVSVQLVQAKSRVAPLKTTSIPRLELIACTIGARLTSFVKNGLQLDGITCFLWSDSTTALAWIRRNDQWGTFVGNRVREICEVSDVNSWKVTRCKLMLV